MSATLLAEQRPEPSRSVLGLILLAAALGGGMPVFVKLGVQSLPPLYFSSLRFLIAALALMPLYLRERKRDNATSPVTLRDRALLLVVVLGNVVNVGFFALGMRYASPTLAQILYLLAPILVYLGSLLFLQEAFSKRKASGVVLGLLGAGLAVLSRASVQGELLGVLLIGIAVLGYSGFSLGSRRMHQRFSAGTQTICMAVMALPILGLLSALFETGQKPVGEFSYSEFGVLLYVGVLGGAVYYALVQLIIRRSSPIAASSVLYLQPFMTMLWSAMILAEPVQLWLLLAGGIAVYGAYLSTRD